MEPDNKRRRGMEAYTFSPLPNATSIRILDVDFNGRCLLDANLPILSFEFVDLNDKPRFDALSYTWGPPRAVYESKKQFEEEVSAGDERKIYIEPDGSTIQVTQSLYDFLCHLKKMHLSPKFPLVEVPKRSHGPHLPTKIWIDAICINQKNTAEKSKQVAMMDKIYSSCQTVFVWLGVSDPFSERAIPILASLLDHTEEDLDSIRNLPVDHENVKQVLGSKFTDPSGLAAIYAFLNRSWFSRAWIVQEVVLAPEVCVLCGGIISSFNVLEDSSVLLWKTGLDNKILHYVHQNLLDDRSDFREAVRLAVAQFTERFRARIESNLQPGIRAFRRSLGKGVEWDNERLRVGGEIMHSDKPALKIFTAKDIVGVEDMPGRAVLRIWAMRGLKTNDWDGYDPSRLLNILDLGRNAQSKDARDKIYAFLGLLRNSKPVPEEEVAYLPTPDYNKDVVEVFHELAWHIIKMGNDLQLLSHVQDRLWTKHPCLPSWVPDWTSRRFPNGIAYTGGPAWSASGDLEADHRKGQSLYEKTLKVRGYLVDKIRKVSELGQVERKDPIRSKFDFTLPAAVALSTPQKYQWHHGLTKVGDTAKNSIAFQGKTVPVSEDDLQRDVFISIYKKSTAVDASRAESRIEALWRTLVMDCINNVSPAPLKYGWAFGKLIRNELENFRFLADQSGGEQFRPRWKTLQESFHALVRSEESAWCEYNVLFYVAKVVNPGYGVTFSPRGIGFIPPLLPANDGVDAIPNHKLDADIDVLEERLLSTMATRKVFATIKHYLGSGPQSLREDDEVWVLEGGKVPFILRPLKQGTSYQFLGEAYVHGIMLGEVLGYDDFEFQDIQLL